MIEEIAEILTPPGQRMATAPPQSFSRPDSLEERIRQNPPPPGVRRFWNTAFKMPDRPRRAAK